MATSDGISTQDWDHVHELSLNIVNAQEVSEAELYTKSLLAHLDALENKYGPLPSILATRADYVVDQEEKSAYLRQAFALAEGSRDFINMGEIAHSLAELYIEEVGDVAEGKLWLSQLLKYSGSSGDSFLVGEAARLKRLLSESTQDDEDSG